MANIYLRLPLVVCYYHRNYDPEHQLANNEPLKFSPYTDHAALLRGGLAVYATASNKQAVCYSHQQWKNIMNGINPNSGRSMIKRDSTVWPTYKEVCDVEGVVISNRSESYDFLCIQIPNEILVGGRMIRTNSSYCLTTETASILQKLLVRDFQRAMINWEIGTFDHCVGAERIISRKHMDTIERFLMSYNIPLPKDGVEKETLRRQLDRWLREARVLEKAYRTFDIEYEDSRDKVVRL